MIFSYVTWCSKFLGRFLTIFSSNTLCKAWTNVIVTIQNIHIHQNLRTFIQHGYYSESCLHHYQFCSDAILRVTRKVLSNFACWQHFTVLLKARWSGLQALMEQAVQLEHEWEAERESHREDKLPQDFTFTDWQESERESGRLETSSLVQLDQ